MKTMETTKKTLADYGIDARYLSIEVAQKILFNARNNSRKWCLSYVLGPESKKDITPADIDNENWLCILLETHIAQFSNTLTPGGK